jgi:aldehyde:ferredoxin oxidoreductase
MLGGYTGAILYVDLLKGEIKQESPDEKLYRDFMGGYGIGARIIYDRQRAKVDPLGPENILGFVTGPLTGVPGTFGSRYTVMAKSPLTGTWGDANSGGEFGPYLKFAGCDAVFFTGISPEPVYLFINDGKAELRSAGHLWGKDTHETEDMLRSELGGEVRVACIGPAGEVRSLLSSIITDKGRAAGRSGLGAVMGSKRLKAVAVMGSRSVPVSDPERRLALSKDYLSRELGFVATMWKDHGTTWTTSYNAHCGDTPVKNWGGVGSRDFPNASALDGQSFTDLVERKYSCWGCTLGCGALMKEGKKYQYEAGVHRPEYETLGAFGTMCLNDDVESVVKASDICNRYGLDTISVGVAAAFAIECYENGIITEEDTGGLRLSWGDGAAIVALTEKVAKREGFGDVLADGVKRAAERIGKGAEKYAFHVGGQELPMHDPRIAPSLATAYQADPTPGRHTQAALGFVEMGAAVPLDIELPPLDKNVATGKGPIEALFKNGVHIVNTSGVCSFSSMVLPTDGLAELLAAVTGLQRSQDELNLIGERIANIRQAFNVREGIKPADHKITGRPVGDPPLDEGPTAGVKVDADTLTREYMGAMGWDLETGKPSRKKLEELGLDDVAEELWPR